MLSKNAAPYLHAVLRENHRLTPALPINLQKDNAAGEVEIHGENFNKGTMFALDSRSLGMDSEYLGGADPDTFLPERWLKDEVEKRKGTHAEVLDHPLLKEPFSAGARKCPGYRVATHEVLVYVSQLMLDWKISLADTEKNKKLNSWRDIEYYQGLTVQPTVPELKFEARL